MNLSFPDALFAVFMLTLGGVALLGIADPMSVGAAALCVVAACQIARVK